MKLIKNLIRTPIEWLPKPNMIDNNVESLVRNKDTNNHEPSKLMDNVISLPMLNGDRTPTLRWRLPVFSMFNKKKYVNNLKRNKYLSKQQRRIQKHFQNNEIKRALSIWLIMAQRSDSYLISTFNNTLKGWYWKWSIAEIEGIIKDVKNILKDWKFSAEYNRVYIPKSNGKKRPLGVPTKPWRIVLKMINDWNIMLVDPIIGDYQFGFRPNRNVWQAWDKIIDQILKGKIIYEFDLKSCFNKISINAIIDRYKKLGVPDSMLFYLRALLTTSPKLPGHKEKIKSWKELHTFPWRIIMKGYIQGYKNINNGKSWGEILENEEELKPFKWPAFGVERVKLGLPQGWSLSPTLAIVAIDGGIKESGWDTIMYADDGLLFLDQYEEINWDSMYKYGMYPSEGLKKDNKTPKCGYVDKYLSFLGITYDITSDKFLTSKGWLPRSEETWYTLKEEYQKKGLEEAGYVRKLGSQNPEWLWDLHPKSVLVQYWPIYGLENLRGLWNYMVRPKSIYRIGLRFLNYQELSSIYSNDIIKIISSLKLKVKKIKFDYKYGGEEIPSTIPSHPIYQEDLPIDALGPDIWDIGTHVDILYSPTNWLYQKEIRYRSNTNLYLDPYFVDIEDLKTSRL